jgi:hypothetical protein
MSVPTLATFASSPSRARARRTAAFAAFRPMWDKNRAQSLLRTFAKIGGIRREQPSYSAFS